MDTHIDPLAASLPREAQSEAARLVQDGFAASFRATLEMRARERSREIARIAGHLSAWAAQPTETVTQTLRLALLLSGLDQWGVAYSQVFGAEALAGLTDLLGLLRSSAADQGLAAIESIELIEAAQENAFTFKADLRRAIHLALWHSMIVEEGRDRAMVILKQVGGMLLQLLAEMPGLGWIIIANTLADIQIRCLAHQLATSGLGQEMTQTLFGSLNQQLPVDDRKRIMPAATQIVIAWQHSTRSTASSH
jgi:hypothetical protein